MSNRIKLGVVGLFLMLALFSGGIALANKSDTATGLNKSVDPGFYVQKDGVTDPGFHLKIGNQAIDPHFYVTLNK
jgi:hypothetical protein